MDTYHAPVLAVEVIDLLKSAKSVLDGTVGGGGHSAALLEAGVARVTGVDRDAEALHVARERLERFEEAGRFRAFLANFADLETVDALAGETFDGVLLDLGVSSRQLDAEVRGFTFREGAPLDMRMGAGEGATDSSGDTAADLLNTLDARRLTSLFKDFGDEPRAARLAREIVRRRATSPFATSDDLVRAIRGALGARSGPSDFARLFQALRIAVNGELEGLERALPVLEGRLRPGGTLAVITYHSGEDRIVKRAFRDWSAECVCPPRQPVCTCRGTSLGTTLTRRPVMPSDAEIARNTRARSAKLRAWRKHDG